MLERFLPGGRSRWKIKKSGQNADKYVPYGVLGRMQNFASRWHGRLHCTPLCIDPPIIHDPRPIVNPFPNIFHVTFITSNLC